MCDAVTSQRSPGWKLASFTCNIPSNRRTTGSVGTGSLRSQKRALPSSPDAASRLPSGLNRTLVHPAGALKNSDGLTDLRASRPKKNLSQAVGGSNVLSVRVERHRADRRAVKP